MKQLEYHNKMIGRRLQLSREILRYLFNHRQRRCWEAEAGGQLFGKIYADVITIERITGPRDADKRGRLFYHPDRAEEQREIDEQYHAGFHFLGDWHTHFQKYPRPSTVDIKSMNDCVRQSKPLTGGLFLIIAGRGAYPGGLHASFHDGIQSHTLTPTGDPIEVNGY